MKRIILAVIFSSILQVKGQEIQWVSKVIKSSSDLGGKQYSSRRVIGRPDAFPQAGDSPNAWAPKNANDGHDFIEVEFAKAQTVKQIAIFENLNSGCLVKIMAGTGDGKYKEVFRNKINLNEWNKKYTEFNRGYYFSRKRRKVVEAPAVNINPGIEYAVLDEPLQNIKALRVVFNFAKTLGDKQIDAIGISDSEKPLLPEINTKPSLESLPDAEVLFGSKNHFTLNFLHENQLFISMDDENGLSKIYSFDKENNKLSNLKLLPASINKNPNYNYLAGINASYYITGGAPYKKSSNQAGYYIFKKDGENFREESPVSIVAFNNFDETSGMGINKDASIILMAVESDICFGALDIYYAKRKDDGTYGFLQNLGKNVNSASDEYNPFLCADEKTLLFASNGYSGFGDTDLYYTVRLDDTWKNWSEPINLGSKVNNYSSQSSVLYDDEKEELYFTNYQDGEYQIKRIKIPKNILAAQ